MRTLAAFLVLAGAAWAQQKTVRPQDPMPVEPATGKLKGQGKAPEVSVRAGTELSYDDNILELNRKQIEELESGTRPDKYRIDEPGDVVYSVWAEVRLKGKVLADPGSVALKIQPYFYQENSIANYEEYELSVRQDFGRHEAGLSYGLERDVYLRELEIVVPGPNLWESATYDEHEIEAWYRHAFPKGLSLKGSVGYRIREFDSPFTYRDREGYVLGLEPSVELGRGWHASVRYEYADLESAASSGEPDTSYTEHRIEFGAGVGLLEKRLEIGLRWRIGFRDYTTDNLPAADPSHVDREDRSDRILLSARFKVSKTWSIEGRYEYEDVDSDRPFDTSPITSEPGDSTRNVFLLGLVFSL